MSPACLGWGFISLKDLRHNMGDCDDEMGFQHRNESAMNCPSSGMNTNPFPQKVSGMQMNTVSMYKSARGADRFFCSGWDPVVSLNQGENFGVSSMVSHNEFATSYPFALENPGISSMSSLDQYSSDPSFVKLMPKVPHFGSGNFSEMVSSIGLPGNVQIASSGCPPNYFPNKEGCNERTSTNVSQSYEDRQISEEAAVGVSTNGKTRKQSLESNSLLNPDKKLELQRDSSGDSSDILKEQDEKNQKIEQNTGANMRGKQAAKQAKDSSNSGEAPKEYIHMRAKRGQATNSHSLAERVRREKISERMRLLQELVPGCNKITGKAVMLDEIINYVQSLQQQVEFLSMKLATVNPELNIDIERILSKDILLSHSGGAAIIGYNSGLNSSRPYPPRIFQGAMPTIPSANPLFPPLPQALLDHEFQSIFQMGYDSTSAVDSLGPNAGCLESEL